MGDDVACIRDASAAKRLHIIGHSWGGIVAQLYAVAHPNTVASLVLLNSSTASQASDLPSMNMAVMKYNKRKCGWYRFTQMGIWSLLMTIPGLADFAARRLFTQIVRNYYYDPATAPTPPADFLSGISARACFAFNNAFVRNVTQPMPISAASDVKSLAIFGEHDIYGKDLIDQFAKRFRVEIISNAGHLPWADQPEALTSVLRTFFVKNV